MTNAVVFPLDEVERYDELVDVLTHGVGVTLHTSTGASVEISPELQLVIMEAAQYFARDKAVSVVPHSRNRFI